MNNLFFLTIVSVITYITSKQCTVSWVDANPAFAYPRQCYNATALVVKEELTEKPELLLINQLSAKTTLLKKVDMQENHATTI